MYHLILWNHLNVFYGFEVLAQIFHILLVKGWGGLGAEVARCGSVKISFGNTGWNTDHRRFVAVHVRASLHVVVAWVPQRGRDRRRHRLIIRTIGTKCQLPSGEATAMGGLLELEQAPSFMPISMIFFFNLLLRFSV